MRSRPRRPARPQLPPETATTAGWTEVGAEAVELGTFEELDAFVWLGVTVLGAELVSTAGLELCVTVRWWCKGALGRLRADLRRGWAAGAVEVRSSTPPVPFVPEPVALVEFLELVTVWPEAVCATTSVRTPAPSNAATASEWFTRVRRRRAASRVVWARVRVDIIRVL
jgi:hypothetical protein